MTTFDMTPRGRLSRRTLLAGTGLVGVGLALKPGRLAHAGPLRALAQDQEPEDIQDILDITATVEAFGVTFLGTGIDSAEQDGFDQPIPADVIAVLKAARAQEQFHLDFFQELGGEILMETFRLPAADTVSSYDAFFAAIVAQETAEIAAQIAAFRTFTALGRADLVKVSFQYAAEEAEHRLVANYALGTRPANDIAFAPAMFDTVAELLALLEARDGPEITFPGPGDIDDSGVTERTPGGPVVGCAPAGTPGAGTPEADG